MFDNLFKKNRYLTVNSHSTTEPKKVQEQKPFIPDGMWVKCDSCGNVIYKKDLEEHQMTCEHCKTHFKLSSQDRIKLTLDAGTFIEYDRNMKSVNPLDYPGYEEKIDGLSAQTDLNEAVITGEGKINGERTVIAVMDSRFMMGSMGSVVGEKITRAVENATKQRLPIIIFTASGGARMQEGMLSLMQMAKVSAALARHDEEGLAYITVLTNPTTGGVTASFAMLGDIILAEPGALIGFAGRRVIEQTIKQALPEGFQTAEFLLEHGFIDDVVPRNKLKDMLGQLLAFHKRR